MCAMTNGVVWMTNCDAYFPNECLGSPMFLEIVTEHSEILGHFPLTCTNTQTYPPPLHSRPFYFKFTNTNTNINTNTDEDKQI